ncbi:MAG: DUF4232 domain-containing protein [Labedaea sp.]
MQIKIGVLAVTGFALLAAGCSSGVSGNVAQPDVRTGWSTAPSGGGSSAPGGASSPSAVPSAGTLQPPAPAAPESAEAAAPGDCRAAELRLSLGQGDAAAGTVYRPLRFTNTGTRNCTIQGFPGVSYVAGDDGHQVGPAAFRVGTKGAPVSLAPGATASAPVGFTQVRNFDPAVCRPTAVRGLRIYPPHDTAAMFVAMEGTGCAGNPPGNQLEVRTVHSGQDN